MPEGWADAITGACHVESDHPRAAATLELGLEHGRDPQSDPPAQGLVVRLARWYTTAGASERRRVVAVRWRRSAADRLYVYLVRGSGREQLGFVDLTTGTVQAAADEHAAVVAQAGALHQATSPAA